MGQSKTMAEITLIFFVCFLFEVRGFKITGTHIYESCQLTFSLPSSFRTHRIFWLQFRELLRRRDVITRALGQSFTVHQCESKTNLGGANIESDPRATTLQTIRGLLRFNDSVNQSHWRFSFPCRQSNNHYPFIHASAFNSLPKFWEFSLVR